MQLIEDSYNFQRVQEGARLNRYFTFRNTGTVPLVITDYKVNCVCTKLHFPLYPILPGAVDSVKLSFDTTSKLGYHVRDVIIKSNAVNTPVKLRFKVFVRKND